MYVKNDSNDFNSLWYTFFNECLSLPTTLSWKTFGSNNNYYLERREKVYSHQTIKDVVLLRYNLR